MRQTLKYTLVLLAPIGLVAILFIVLELPIFADIFGAKKVKFKQEFITSSGSYLVDSQAVELAGYPGETLVFDMQVVNAKNSKIENLYLISGGLSGSSGTIESSQIIVSPGVTGYSFNLNPLESKPFNFKVNLGSASKGEYKGLVEVVSTDKTPIGSFEINLKII